MILIRHAYLTDCTLGWLVLSGLRLATLERPWIPSAVHRGGMPQVSCIPDGTYRLVAHEGPRFRNVWALVNPTLDVHQFPSGPGRSAILIHSANRVQDLAGCIAVGLEHGRMDGQHAVMRSASALSQLHAELGSRLPHIEIRAIRGTSELG